MNEDCIAADWCKLELLYTKYNLIANQVETRRGFAPAIAPPKEERVSEDVQYHMDLVL